MARPDLGGGIPNPSNDRMQRTLADPPVRTDLEEGMAVSLTRHRSACSPREPAEVVTFGVFHFAGHVPVGKIADFYGLPVPEADKATPVGDFIADRLPAKPAAGDSIGIGMFGLVVHDVNGEWVTRVGLEL
jgi:NhaP-type Na+/H+ and K+/H+ antiporter